MKDGAVVRRETGQGENGGVFGEMEKKVTVRGSLRCLSKDKRFRLLM